MSENPYTSPETVNSMPEGKTEEEKLRNSFLQHESSIKSVALLYSIGGMICLFLGLVYLVAVLASGESTDLLMAPSMLGIGAILLWTAMETRKLRQRARIGVGLISGLGLLAFPLGTIVNAYILYLVFSRKGTMVFSPRYRQAIAATPHIESRTSIVVWIVLGLFLAAFALLMLHAFIVGQGA